MSGVLDRAIDLKIICSDIGEDYSVCITIPIHGLNKDELLEINKVFCRLNYPKE